MDHVHFFTHGPTLHLLVHCVKSLKAVVMWSLIKQKSSGWGIKMNSYPIQIVMTANTDKSLSIHSLTDFILSVPFPTPAFPHHFPWQSNYLCLLCPALSCNHFIPSSSLSSVLLCSCVLPSVSPLLFCPLNFSSYLLIPFLFPFLIVFFLFYLSPLLHCPSVGSSSAVSGAHTMRRSTTVPIWGSNPRRRRSRPQNYNIRYMSLWPVLPSSSPSKR